MVVGGAMARMGVLRNDLGGGQVANAMAGIGGRVHGFDGGQFK